MCPGRVDADPLPANTADCSLETWPWFGLIDIVCVNSSNEVPVFVCGLQPFVLIMKEAILPKHERDGFKGRGFEIAFKIKVKCPYRLYKLFTFSSTVL